MTRQGLPSKSFGGEHCRRSCVIVVVLLASLIVSCEVRAWCL